MDPTSCSVRPARRGNALMLVLGIALLLGIQVYIVQTFTMGSFRHVEKVNAHIRAIYVGESAFSRILAKLKADTWENRFFKGITYRDYNEPLSGGSFSSVVVDVPPPAAPAASEKLVDVWIEARYEGSISLMYYRVLYSDDTLDFTAQVYPRFFTFLDADSKDPFKNTLPEAIDWIKGQLTIQSDNEGPALAALEQVKASCSLAGVGTALGVPLASGVDTAKPLVANVAVSAVADTNLCDYVNSVNGALAGIVPPPLALTLPPPPPAVSAANDFVAEVRAAFLATWPGAVLPLSPSEKVSSPAFALAHVHLVNRTEADKQWKLEHHGKRYEHYMKAGEMIGFIQNMLRKRATPSSADEVTQINAVAERLLAWVSTRAGTTYSGGTEEQYVSAFQASVLRLKSNPDFAEPRGGKK